jgi:predicted NAD/FAD-dependent oxidoreductase
MRDSLGAKRAASDMLIPRVDLTLLFPQKAADYIARSSGSVVLGSPVQQISISDRGWALKLNEQNAEIAEQFDGVIIATSALQAASLLSELKVEPPLPTFEYEPITTCYLQYPAYVKLDAPFFALIDNAETAEWGQFVFDRGQLDPVQAGLLAVVVSASSDAIESGHDALSAAIAAQLAKVFVNPDLAQPTWSKVISDKRATFSCTPGLTRPSEDVGLRALVIAGDYVASDYPATLESAVRSGVKAARLLSEKLSSTTVE